MVELTRLNGHAITVNSDLIKFVEAIPDTVVCLVTGDRLLVRELPEEVVRRVSLYRGSVLCHAWPDAGSALAAAAAIQGGGHGATHHEQIER